MIEKNSPRSCDTFVVLQPFTDSNFHIFGKNSDRPSNEVQEVIFVSKQLSSNKKDFIKCTYIEVPQVPTTYRCVLSKPAWCWGAEMGANEHGVCIGNEAVYSKIPYDNREKSLIGMDIVRLALERSTTAKSAVDVIGNLIEQYGQGGTCFDSTSNMSSGYDNSFLIVDHEEAWLVESCDRVWVAKHIKEGYCNISNLYTIEDDYTIHSKNLETFAKEKQLWNENERLNFSKTFQDLSTQNDQRLKCGRRLLENLTKNGNFSAFDMISILRDDQSGICMIDANGFTSTGSQVSVITNKITKSSIDACHFFTATPNPKLSLFKPFIFSDNVELGPLTVSTPVEITHERIHPLYAAHKKATREQLEHKRLRDFEHEGIMEILVKLKTSNENNVDTYETLFHDTTSAEIELIREYKQIKRS